MSRLVALCLGLIVGVLLLCTGVSPTPVNYSLASVTWGPKPINPLSTALINATMYNSSLPPVNYSWPVLKLAGVITEAGVYDQYANTFSQTYSFMVDMINLHGGIRVHGTDYLLSLTWASDDSSSSYLLYLYSLWLSDPSYSIFLSPSHDDQIKLLNPMMVESGQTFFNFICGDPANFLDEYPYLWTFVNERDHIPLFPFNVVNERAIQYHSDLQNGLMSAFPGDSHTSQFGILTVCMYTHNDPAQIQSCNGIRNWINNTNLARRQQGANASDLVVILVDVLWSIPITAVDQNLYSTSFNLCPDRVDALVVCGEMNSLDAAAVAAALATTRLRPKVAYTTSSMPGYTPTNSTMLNQWPGWVTLGSFPPQPSTMPDATFPLFSDMAQSFSLYFNITTVPPLSAFYPAGFEVLKGALSSSLSLSPADLRNAFLSLSGNNYVRGVQMNNATGANDGNIAAPAQFFPAGLVVIVNTSQIVYPYDWPWTRFEVGDFIDSAQSGSNVVLALVLAVLGCWVAQIILEQAVYVRRRGGWYPLWLLPVSVSLGGAGIWCSQFTMTSALSWSLPGTTSQLPFTYSLDIALLAWLPAILLTWSGLMVMIQDVEKRTLEGKSQRSEADAVRQARNEKEDEKRKLAALSFYKHLVHLKESMSRRLLVGALLLVSAVFFSRITFTYVWSLQAVFVSSAAGWIASLLLCLPLITGAMLIDLHALRWRIVAVFMLAISIIADWQIQIALGQFTYAAAVLDSPTSLYTVALSSTAVLLIAGIVAAITCFGFVGLQFSRMQLSRNDLGVLVVSLEHTIQELREDATKLKKSLALEQAQKNELVKMIECITLLSPTPKEYAFAMAAQSNWTILLDIYDVHSGSRIYLDSSTDSIAGLQNGIVKEVSRTSKMAARISQIVSEQSIERETGTQSKRNSQGSPRNLLHASSDLRSRHNSVESTIAWGGPMERPINPVLQSNQEKDALALSTSHHPRSKSIDRTSLSSKIDSERSRPEVCRKRYEKALLPMLSQQTRTHSFLHQTQSSSERGIIQDRQHPSSIMKTQDFASYPPLSFDAKAKVQTSEECRIGDITPVVVRAIPSLAELLQHPVCVELVKSQLQSVYSVENLMFYLHVVRYRKLLSAKARKLIASHIFETFIAEGSNEQINISTQQRSAIAKSLQLKSEEGCGPNLFRDAEREVFLLIQTNVMNGFIGSARHGACVWIYHKISLRRVSGDAAVEEMEYLGGTGEGTSVLLLASRVSNAGREDGEAD